MRARHASPSAEDWHVLHHGVAHRANEHNPAPLPLHWLRIQLVQVTKGVSPPVQNTAPGNPARQMATRDMAGRSLARSAVRRLLQRRRKAGYRDVIKLPPTPPRAGKC